MHGGVVGVVCVSENHLSTLPDIDIYSTEHNGEREDGGAEGDVG